MTEAQLNGITIAYEDSGSGPAVLLTHGYGAAGAMWQPQRKPLNDAGYRFISWDMRGHGGTDSPDDPAAYSEALTIGDMTALLDHLGVQQAVIGGLSLGGFMSLAFGREKASRLSTMRRHRWTSVSMIFRYSSYPWRSVGSRSCARSASASQQARIVASGLLISCITPAAS